MKENNKGGKEKRGKEKIMQGKTHNNKKIQHNYESSHEFM